MKITVVSSLYGGYDQPTTPPVQDVECEWVLVTDQDYDVKPWRVVVEPRPQLHPRLAAKVAKCRPDLYAEADVYIWVDASFHIYSSDFVAWCAKSLLDTNGLIAQIPHPDRIRIVDEADVSSIMGKYGSLPVHAQVMHYLRNGYVDGWGLWATGLRVQREDPLLHEWGDAWLAEQVRWTYQDQLSEPYVLWKYGIRPVDLDGPLRQNPRFGIKSHRDDQ